MHLYRPTGKIERSLVFDTNMKAWPPHLSDQPIFYPVLNQAYAEQIARDWNTKFASFAGFATSFEVDDYISRFKPEQVGGKEHLELWIPAEELDTFKHHIRSPISVVTAFYGENYDNASDGYLMN